jgi:hypothetical protein
VGSIIATSKFEKSVEDRLKELAEESDLNRDALLSEFLNYLPYAGQRVQVRMSSGRLQVHRAFDIWHPSVRHSPIEPSEPGDERLPVYSMADFRWLDGLARDVREAADELGLSCDVALSVLKRCSKKNKRPAEAVAPTVADKIKDPGKYKFLTMPEVMQHFRISRSTAYRWAEEGKLKRPGLGKQAGRRGKFYVLTESVVNLHEESSE